MAQSARPATTRDTVKLDPRWISLAFVAFTGVLLVYELARATPAIAPPVSKLPLLVLLSATALLSGSLIAARRGWQRRLALGLLLGNTVLSLVIIALDGGIGSPFWVALFIPLLTALLLTPGRAGIGTAAAIWCGYGALIWLAPAAEQVAAAATWLLHTAQAGLLVVVLERLTAAQAALVERTRSREMALRNFLRASNRLRVSTQLQRVLEEVADSVQNVGDFDCVAICRTDWRRGMVEVSVAIGASGRRHDAVEGLSLHWRDFAGVIDTGERVGTHATLCTSLPFRSANSEQHLVVPMVSQLDEVYGLLTVSVARERRALLDEALPLLELLANHAATAIDNGLLFATLEQRVQQATADIERSAADLRRAHSRIATLYNIARRLSASLDERQLLDEALTLVVKATSADHGGILMLEPNGSRLAYRATLDPQRRLTGAGAEAGRGLAGLVLTSRKPVIINDLQHDIRRQIFCSFDDEMRAILAVPIMLEHEARGVLMLFHSAANHFTDDHAQLVLAAGGQCAVALSKAELYRFVTEQSDRLSVLARQREEEASKLIAILRSIGDGVVVGDRLGRVRIINPAAEQILGLTSEAFLGRALTELPGVPHDDAAAPNNRLAQFAVGASAVRAHYAPVSTDDEWLGSVVVYHDITREVMADKLKSEFVATASHELRTPLTSIRGYVDMLLLDTFGSLNDPQREFLEIIKRNVGLLVDLIDELLDISRAEAGEIRLRREPVDVATAVEEVTRSLYSQFSERNIRLSLQIAADVPPTLADPQRLQQILVNLVGNACKYTLPGGYVAVTLSNGGDELQIDVRDSGVGIAEEAQPHIFTPFFRADNPLRDEVGGTGLGLNITRKLVELHGGRIWFTSKTGEGSTFSFTLPLITAHVAAGQDEHALGDQSI